MDDRTPAGRAGSQEDAMTDQGGARYRRMVECSPVGMHFYRLREDGRLILEDSNPAAHDILGIDHRPLLGKTIEDAFPGLAGTEIPERYRDVAVHGGVWRDTQSRYQDDRVAGVYEVNAFQTSPGHMVATFLDISARWRAEEEQRASDARLRLVLRQSRIVVFEQDASLRYTDVLNPHPELGEEDVLGKRDEDLLLPDEAAALTALKRTAMETGEVQNGHVRTTIDGNSFFYDLTVEPSRDQEGRVVGVTCVSIDVTQRKSLEEQLFQAQKMESVGRLAAGIAHDFNNFLTVVLANSGLLLEDIAPDDPMSELLRETQEAAVHAQALTTQLLTFSRQKRARPRVVDPNDVVRGVQQMLRRVCGETIHCDFDLDPGLHPVLIDPTQLEQVMMNLATNARDAMPDGGRFSISTRNIELDESYAQTHLAVPPGRYASIVTSDTGVGMDREIVARIFEPFFTTKEETKGTGLGLSTVYGIVKQASGSIFVYSEPGRGTTFKIYLPWSETEEQHAPEATEPYRGDSLAGGRETVLVVDDVPSVLAVMGRVLRKFGYTVVEAADAAAALDVASELSNFDLLVTDFVLPGMNGRELAACLREDRPALRVLLVSGYTRGEALHHSADAEMAYLEKPFTAEELVREVRTVLDRA